MELVFRNVQLSFREYAWLSLRFTFKQHPVLVMPLLVLPLCALVLLGLVLLHPERLGSLLGSGQWPMFLLPLLGLLLPVSTWRGLRRNYQTTKFIQLPATYFLTEAGLRIESPYMQAHVKWELVLTAHQVASYYLLMTNAAVGFFLDFRCLEPPATEADFRALLARHRVAVK